VNTKIQKKVEENIAKATPQTKTYIEQIKKDN
jgi:hypothetical protein